VLDEAWEREIRDPAAGKMPPRRRLTLQKICWESKLENLRTTHWQEAAGALGILRERVRRREEGLAARIGRLEREIAFLRSLRALNLRLFLGLDLSSGSDSFGIFERGNPDGPPYEGRGPVSPFADRLSAIAERIEGLCGLLAEGRPRSLPPFVNSFKPLKNLDPRSCLAAMMKFDMEACYASNRTAGTFCTMSDPRPWVATPNDTLERVDVPNVARQVRLMVPMLKALLDAAEPLAGESDLHDHSGTATVHALTVPRGGAIVPDHPVDGAIIVDKATDQVRNAWYLNIKPYACGVRENHVAIADEEGAAVFPTGWHEVFTQPPRPFEAYRLDADTGEIVYALDRGVSGAQKFSNEIILDRARKQGTLVLFRCQPVGLFDLVDPRYMSLLRRIDVLAAEDDSPPLQFGYNLSTQPAGGYETETAGESCAVVYLEPGKKFKATMSAGIIGLRLALLNMPDVEAGCRGKAPPLQPRPSLPSPSLGRGWGGGFGRCPAPTGEGYAPDATARLPLTPWLIARDMWRLDEIRIRNLNARGISNELLERLHLQAGERLRLAGAALDARRYSAALAHAREAWAYESRAYPLVRSAADDAIKGIVFYLFLLLPFAFFAERLLFSFPKILHRILGAVGVFLAVFLVLRFTHPAFKLTTSPAMVLLAFITLALAIVVIFLLGGKVADQLRRLRQREGARSVDVNRFSTLRAAFMLGIGNLRKRPVRTGLTAATLVLMSFTVVSFTSVKFVPRYNKLDTNEAAPYDGILVKRPQWSAVDSQVHDGIEALYGGQYAVVPRGWFIGYTQLSIPGRPAPAVKVVPKPDAQGPPAAPEHAWPVVPTMMGLDVREPEVTGVDAFLSAGRWFSSSDASECILPTELAETLELSPADAGRVSIEACGQELLVVGIVDSQRLGALLDLNGEPVTPIDTTIVQTTSKSKEETLADHYRHFLPQDTILVPYRRLQAFGRSAAGTFRLASVAVAMGSGESGTAVVKAAAETAAEEVIRRYMTSKAVNLYVGIGGRSYFYSVPGMLSFSGLRNVALPLAIAALIVLNTMLGAVYERFKDIYIFSAIGLAPSHIGTLFLAESCVFATIGGVAGYLMGQIFSVVFIRTGLLGGLTLNYSSGSVVTAMLVVMAVVVLSSLYPAHKASRLASPAIDRKWTLPQEEADRVAVELPFNVEDRDAEGLLAFIAHYFLAHREAGVGSFTSSDVSCERSGGGVLRLRAHVWMAPYDLGVSQSVGIEVAPPDEAGIRAVHLELLRESGEPRSWRKTSFILLDGLRKQFLRWRTVPEAERRRSAGEFQAFCKPS